jgi:chromosome segregation ATPase
MNPPASSDALRRELAAIRAELEQLDRRDAQLLSALGDLEHDMRRCTDALERVGWRFGEGEARHGMLAENHRAIIADRENLRIRKNQLGECLKSIQQRLNEDERNG